MTMRQEYKACPAGKGSEANLGNLWTMTVTALPFVPRQPLRADPKSFHPLTLLVTDVYLNFRTICFLFLTSLLIYNSQTIQFTH